VEGEPAEAGESGMNAHSFLTTEETARVEAAIAEAEQTTAAEFVCAVATESGRYDRAESVLGLVFSLIFLGLAYTAPTFSSTASSGSWTEVSPPGLPWLALAVVGGFLAGNLLGTHLHGLRRLLVSQKEMEEETLKAASHVFALRRISGAEARAGVLIYLSLFERRVVILADHAAGQALSTADIEALRDIALEKLVRKERSQSFLATLEAACEHLIKGLPPLPEGSRNELPNELAIFHPRP